MKVAKVHILVLFLILEKMLSSFSLLTTILAVYGLYYVELGSPLSPISGESLSQILNFIKGFFCIY